MTTRKKSDAIKYLEHLAGGSLTFGSMLESIRLGEEMSQTAFAKKLQISPSHLCDIEKGRKVVSALRAARFANTLKKSVPLFVRLALQDELERSGINLKISLQSN